MQDGYDLAEPHSLAFYGGREHKNFTCAPVRCSSTELDRGYGYFMAATSHSNTFELLVFRVCRFLQTCIKHQHIFVTLHHINDVDEHGVFKKSSEFLTTLGIPHNAWPGQFTSNTKMVHYMESLNGLKDPQKYIFHADLDEIVDPETLRQAVSEMDRDECDFITGVWQDRVTLDGYLNRVELKNGLEIEEQYPLRCTYSANFMPERTTRKVVVYRSNLRLSSGQHEVWCDIEAASHVKWNRNGACRAHVEKRQDKSTRENYILRLLPENLITKPRQCKTQVIIDHYKFIAGVTKHLVERMNSYRKLNLTWWKQSLEILKNIKASEGRICTVKCPQYKCFLKELPNSYHAHPMLNFDKVYKVKSNPDEVQTRDSISSTALSESKLSPEIAAQIEKTIGFRIFSDEKFQAGERKHEGIYQQSSQEEGSQEDNIDTTTNSAASTAAVAAVIPAELSGHGDHGVDPHPYSAVQENNDVAVTTLYNPKEIEDRIKKLTAQLKQVDPLAVAHTGPPEPIAHPMHPLAGSKRDIDNLARMSVRPRMLLFGEAIMLKLALPDMREVWMPFMKGFKAMNMAIGSERSRTLFHRIRYSDWSILTKGKDMEVKKAPLVVSIMVGTNDVGKGESADEIVAVIDAIVKECIEKIPDITNVIVLSILPRALESFNQMIFEVNEKLGKMYADTKLLNGGVYFVDLTPIFRANDGSIRKSMYLPDRFHPSPLGYLNLLKSLVPTLDEIYRTYDTGHVTPQLPDSVSSKGSLAHPKPVKIKDPNSAAENPDIRGGDAAKEKAREIALELELKKQQEAQEKLKREREFTSVVSREDVDVSNENSASHQSNSVISTNTLPTSTKAYEMIDLEAGDR